MNDDYDDDSTTPKKVDPSFQPPKNATPTNTKKDNRQLTPHGGGVNDDEEDPEKNGGPWRSEYNFPPSSTLYEKMSKEDAGYRKGVPFENCGKCNYYQSGHCKVVRGYIEQSMVCKYFSEKYMSSMTISVMKRK